MLMRASDVNASRSVISSSFDFDKGEDVAAPRNQVNLVHLGAIAPGKDAIARKHEPERRQTLPGMTPPVGTLPTSAWYAPLSRHVQPFRFARGTTSAAIGWIGSSGKTKRQ